MQKVKTFFRKRWRGVAATACVLLLLTPLAVNQVPQWVASWQQYQQRTPASYSRLTHVVADMLREEEGWLHTLEPGGTLNRGNVTIRWIFTTASTDFWIQRHHGAERQDEKLNDILPANEVKFLAELAVKRREILVVAARQKKMDDLASLLTNPPAVASKPTREQKLDALMKELCIYSGRHLVGQSGCTDEKIDHLWQTWVVKRSKSASVKEVPVAPDSTFHDIVKDLADGKYDASEILAGDRNQWSWSSPDQHRQVQHRLRPTGSFSACRHLLEDK